MLHIQRVSMFHCLFFLILTPSCVFVEVLRSTVVRGICSTICTGGVVLRKKLSEFWRIFPRHKPELQGQGPHEFPEGFPSSCAADAYIRIPLRAQPSQHGVYPNHHTRRKSAAQILRRSGHRASPRLSVAMDGARFLHQDLHPLLPEVNCTGISSGLVKGAP